MDQESHVLVVFPHPDDEAFGTSATLSMHVDQGVPVTYACLTYGDMGRNLGYPPFATRESLHEVRKKEVERAAELIGIQDLRLLGYRDKTLEFEPDGELSGVVRDMILELKPSKLISFYPGYSVHPDHEATADAVIEAVRSLPKADRPKLHLVAFAQNTEEDLGQPDVVINIDGYQDRKHDVIAAHESQTKKLLEDLAKQTTPKSVRHERWFNYESYYTYDVE